MFTNLLPTSEKLFNVRYLPYAEGHYLKSFIKKYPGIQWDMTNKSIIADLGRLRMPNNTTQQSQQIDELKHKDCYWLAKYDFKIAGTKESTKSSGNRAIVFIDTDKDELDIMMIYHKSDLPKNKDETAYVMNTVKEQYGEYAERFE